MQQTAVLLCVWSTPAQIQICCSLLTENKAERWARRGPPGHPAPKAIGCAHTQVFCISALLFARCAVAAWPAALIFHVCSFPFSTMTFHLRLEPHWLCFLCSSSSHGGLSHVLRQPSNLCWLDTYVDGGHVSTALRGSLPLCECLLEGMNWLLVFPVGTNSPCC